MGSTERHINKESLLRTQCSTFEYICAACVTTHAHLRAGELAVQYFLSASAAA